MMTLLDDYEAPYKLRGIRVVSDFLARAPPHLLQRTGVDGLLFSVRRLLPLPLPSILISLRQSLRTTLTNLHNPTTPSLIRAAVPTLLTLIQHTTKPGSTERFNQLCVLLGESIIGSVWLYAANDKDTIEASVEVLPGVVSMLRVGCVRYLKVRSVVLYGDERRLIRSKYQAIIPQLTHPLLADSPLYYTTQHKLLSLTTLRTIMQACAPRMHRWKEVVLEGVAKCWVVLTESDVMPENEKQALKNGLKETVKELTVVCPTVLADEYPRFMATDAELFSDLFG